MLRLQSVVGGKYKILDQIGKGGMSILYLARNEEIGKQWAVKEVNRQGMSQDKIDALMRETDIAKKLDHPNIIRIVDRFEENGSIILLMDLIEGMTLKEKLKSNLEKTGKAGESEGTVIEWAKQVTKALVYMHEQYPYPVIHRDIKPENIMLKTSTQDVVLFDFGIAKEMGNPEPDITKGQGTASYAAPEQYSGAEHWGRAEWMNGTDVRTDIYNLGATLFHLVTGIQPQPAILFDKQNGAAGEIVENPIPPVTNFDPSISDALSDIIFQCTRLDPRERYQSAGELLTDLEYIETKKKNVKRKQKIKIGVFVASCALTVALTATSFTGYASAENRKKQNFEYLLYNADSVQDYYDAILTDPTRVEAYIGNTSCDGLVQFLLADDVLSVDENISLVKLKGGLEEKNGKGYTSSVDVLSRLRSSSQEDYERVCYEIGEAYLFDYDVKIEKDKYAAAASWFQYIEQNDSYPAAKIYCVISDSLQNIAKYKKSEEYERLITAYQSLWEQITQLSTDSDQYEDGLKVRVWQEIVNMINNNTSEFYQSISSKEDLLKMLDSIDDRCNGIKNTFIQNKLSELRTSVIDTRKKVESIK